MNCPRYEQLAQAAFSQPEPDTWRTHLGACPRCAARVALLTRMRHVLAAGELPAVPPALTRAAEQLAGHQPSAGRGDRPGWLSGLRILVAELLPGPELVPAVRRASPTELRLLYRAGNYEIDLFLTPQRKLLGQVVPTDESELRDGRCTLIGEQVQHTSLSPTGEFQFKDAGHGPASLTFEWDGTRVLLPEVDLPD